jgi:hypothetical protein
MVYILIIEKFDVIIDNLSIWLIPVSFWSLPFYIIFNV